jgi:hypothetical protein
MSDSVSDQSKPIEAALFKDVASNQSKICRERVQLYVMHFEQRGAVESIPATLAEFDRDKLAYSDAAN